jgi:hypothetical protein
VAAVAAVAGVLAAATPARADITVDSAVCMATSTAAVWFPDPEVTWGETTALHWTANLGPGCSTVGPVLRVYKDGTLVDGPVFGPASDRFMNVTPPKTGQYTVRLVATLTGAQKDLNSAAVTVNPYEPDPFPLGQRDVTIPDDGPVWRRIFVRALRSENATIRIDGDVDLDLSGLESAPVASGVKLVGDRSAVAAGPRLFTTTFPRELLRIGDGSGSGSMAGNDVRVTGVRLDGGMSDDPFSAVGKSDADGFAIYGGQNVEIDHGEIYHWRGSGVNVHDNENRLLNQSNADTVWIHDNFIHHNQHPSASNCAAGALGDHHATGYGVVVSGGAYARVERNVFDWNRHAIAGSGSDGDGYLLYRNLFLRHGGVHFRCVNAAGALGFVLSPFNTAVAIVAGVLDDLVYHTHIIDMHGSNDDGPGDQSGGLAGEYMDIEYNTVLYTAGNGIHLRGTPRLATGSPAEAKVGMDVKHNVFAHGRQWGDTVTNGWLLPGAMFQNETGLHDEDNRFGVNTFDDRRSCDFDGDGSGDDFIATGATWWYASSALAGRWVFLNQSTVGVDGVTLADVNGDGLCDVTAGGTVFPTTTGSISLSRRSGTALRGGSVTTQVSLTRSTGPSAPATLSVAGLPAGVTASFNPPAVSAANPTSTLTLNAAAAQPGTYTVTVGTGSPAVPVTYELKVQDFLLSLEPNSGTVPLNGGVTTRVRLTPRNGFSGSVNLGTVALPSGVTASFNPTTISPANPTSTLTLAAPGAAPGGHLVVVRGVSPSGGPPAVVDYGLSVPLGYTASLSLQSGSVAQGGSVTTEATLTPLSSVVQIAHLTTKDLPEGVAVSFDPPDISSQEPTSIVTLTATSQVAPGTYNFTIGVGPIPLWYQLNVGDGEPNI